MPAAADSPKGEFWYTAAMNYLYHSVPKHLQGSVLYPLNDLKERLPDVYEKEAGKYAGRGHIMQQRIPRLDCLWNDVLHFTAVHPRDVQRALAEAGRPEPWTQACYQVDPRLLDAAKAVVYLNSGPWKGSVAVASDFLPFDLEKLAEYAALPQTTREYYGRAYAEGKAPLLYVGVPHILYKGSLDIGGLPIVTV